MDSSKVHWCTVSVGRWRVSREQIIRQFIKIWNVPYFQAAQHCHSWIFWYKWILQFCAIFYDPKPLCTVVSLVFLHLPCKYRVQSSAALLDNENVKLNDERRNIFNVCKLWPRNFETKCCSSSETYTAYNNTRMRHLDKIVHCCCTIGIQVWEEDCTTGVGALQITWHSMFALYNVYIAHYNICCIKHFSQKWKILQKCLKVQKRA